MFASSLAARSRHIALNALLCVSLLASVVSPAPASALSNHATGRARRSDFSGSQISTPQRVSLSSASATVVDASVEESIIADDEQPPQQQELVPTPAPLPTPDPAEAISPTATAPAVLSPDVDVPNVSIAGETVHSSSVVEVTPLSYGQTVTGTVAAPGQVVTYTFNADDGDVVLVRISENENSNFAPQAQLYAPDGSLLASNWNYNLLEFTHTLTMTGGYTLAVGDFGSTHTGSFNLHFQRLNGPANAAPIAYGQTVTGIVAGGVGMDARTFVASGGDVVLVRVSNRETNFRPHVRLYAPDGGLLAAEWNYLFVLEITRTLSTPGTYTLLVGDENGLDTGRFSLHLQRFNLPIGIKPISYGETSVGSTVLAAELHTYSFNANAGDVVLVQARDSVQDSAWPRVALYAPNGDLLASNEHEYRALITRTLTAAGTYLVLFGEYFGAAIESYGLHVQRLNQPANAISITFGQSISSSIAVTGELDAYTFVADAGDILLASASTSINLPEIRLYSPDGSLLAIDNSNLQAELTQTLTVAGTYIVTLADNGGTGFWDYSMHLQRLNGARNAVPIGFGQTLTGSIGFAAEFAAYDLNAYAGDVLLIGVSDILYDNFWPEVRLYAPDGRLVAQDWKSQGRAEVRYTVTATGTHLVLVGNHRGTHIGSYGVHPQRLNAPGKATPIYSGQVLTGAITMMSQMNAYQFSAAANQVVDIEVHEVSPGGYLDPEVHLYGPRGNLVISGSGVTRVVFTDTLLTDNGSYTILVRDYYGYYYNGLETGTYTLSMTLLSASSLLLGSAITGTIHSHETQLYSLTVNNPGQKILVEVVPLAGVTELWLTGLLGAPPIAGRHDQRVISPTMRGTYELLFDTASPGTHYFSVFGRALSAPLGNYQITARLVDRHISDVLPRRAGNVGETTFSIAGIGLVDGMQIELRRDGATRAADRVMRLSPMLISAHIDLRGAAVGNYDLRVVWPNGAGEVTIPNAVEVVVGVGARLEARLEAPDVIRRLRPAVMWLEYTNIGDADMPAPLFVISTTHDTSWRHGTQGDLSLGTLQVLGISPSGLAGVLAPGARRRIPITLQTGASAGTQIGFTLSQMIADTTAINWGEIEEDVRPDGLSDELWAVVWANFKARMGTTWADYQRALDEQATYFSTYGHPTDDVRVLLSAILGRASGIYLRQTLASGLDAYAPGRGLPLALARTAYDTLDQRYTVGPFGRGWSHSFEYSLTQPDLLTIVVRGPAGSGRSFVFDRATGAWQPQTGDYSRLSTLPDGSHQLREQGGVTWLFNPAGQLTTIEESNSNRLSLSYDGAGRLIAIVHSNGQSLTLSYTAQGRIGRLTDHAVRATDYAYDASGEYLTSVTAPGGVITRYAYAANRALQTITFPDGTHVNYTYGAQGRLASRSRDNDAERVTFSYDPLGTVAVTDATNGTTTLRLGPRGEPLEVQDPLGHRVRFEYDCCSQLTRVTQPDGATYGVSYDAWGNPSQSVDPLRNATTTGYTTDYSRLDWLRDARGNLTDFTYDNGGNLARMTYPDGSHEDYTYDGSGNVVSSTNRRGAAISYAYDAFGRMTRKTYPDSRTIDYTYDALGNLTSAADSATGTITMQYDARGFLARIDYPGGRWFALEYSDAGRRTRRTGHDGYVLNYAYDAAGRLQRLSDGANAEIIRYEYEAAGRLSRENKANGTYSIYGYDAAGQLLSLVNHAPNGSVQSRFDYTYDSNGNRTAMATMTGTTRYSYDDLGQLTGVTYPDNRQVSYVYDALGNRVTVTDNSTVTSYTTNALNQYTQVGNATFGYDADGNMTSRAEPSGTTTYAYDAENRLTSVTAPGNSTSQYIYDALGNRITAVRSGATTGYLHDPIGLVDVAAEYDGGGTLVARYVHGLGLVSRNSAGGATYYSFDGTGHTRQMTDGGGAVVNSYDYDPFGVPLATNEVVANPFRYVGRFGVMEEDNGMQFMRARYFAEVVGRFLMVDPLRLASGSENLYLYSQNDPLGRIDPQGLIHIVVSPNLGPARLGEPLAHTNCVEDPDTIWIDAFPPSPQIFVSTILHEVVHVIQCKAGLPVRGTPLYEAPAYAAEIAAALLTGIDRDPVFYTRRWYFFVINVIAAIDPNEKSGPPGIGPTRIVKPNDDLRYTIFFENVMTATAPAVQVVVVDRLDPNLDWTTFRPTEIAFGDQTFALSQGAGGASLRATIPDYRPTVNKTWWVDMSAQVNYQTGAVTWTLQTLDPLTGQPPDDPLAGFLPPNDATHRGEGHVSFSVGLLPNRPLNTVVTNEAAITFDSETTIVTNRVTNTVAWVVLLPLVVRDFTQTTRVNLPAVMRR